MAVPLLVSIRTRRSLLVFLTSGKRMSVPSSVSFTVSSCCPWNQSREFAADDVGGVGFDGHLPVADRVARLGRAPGVVRLVQSAPCHQPVGAGGEVEFYAVGRQFLSGYGVRGEETAFLVVDIEFHLFGLLLVGHLVGEGVGELHIIGIGELRWRRQGGRSSRIESHEKRPAPRSARSGSSRNIVVLSFIFILFISKYCLHPS